MSSTPTDGVLLDGWASGDQKCGAVLFDRHYGPISRFFRNKAGDAADDLIQQTFMGCIEARDRFASASSFRTYLFGIARNVLYNHYRALRIEGRTEAPDFSVSTLAELAPSMTSLIAAAGRDRALLEALRQIPLQFQVVLELAFWERLTAREIAEIVDVPEGTVRTRLARAKELVAKELRRIENLSLPLHTTIEQLDGWAAGIRQRLLPRDGETPAG